MDAATKVQLSGLLFTAVLPAAAVLGVAFVGRKLKPDVEHRWALGSLAVLTGVVVAWLGIGGMPGFSNAQHWPIWTGIVAGALGLGLDLKLRGKVVPIVLVAGAVIALGAWQTVAPMKAAWQDGVVTALAGNAWVLDAAAIAIVVWIGVDHAARCAPTPAVLGPIALACAGAAGISVLSHSALVGQLFGGIGLAIGLAALFGWWKPDFKPGHGAVGIGIATLATLLIYGQIATETSRPASTLILLAPLAALGGMLAKRTLISVLIAGGLAAAPVAVALWITQGKIAAEDAKAGEKPSDGPDYGSMGNY